MQANNQEANNLTFGAVFDDLLTGLEVHPLIQLQYIFVVPGPNRGAWVGPELGGTNQASRQDHTGFEENLV